MRRETGCSFFHICAASATTMICAYLQCHNVCIPVVSLKIHNHVPDPNLFFLLLLNMTSYKCKQQYELQVSKIFSFIFLVASYRIFSHFHCFLLYKQIQSQHDRVQQQKIPRHETTMTWIIITLFCCDFSAIILLHFYYPTTVIVENLLICTRKHAAHCLLT